MMGEKRRCLFWCRCRAVGGWAHPRRPGQLGGFDERIVNRLVLQEHRLAVCITKATAGQVMRIRIAGMAHGVIGVCLVVLMTPLGRDSRPDHMADVFARVAGA